MASKQKKRPKEVIVLDGSAQGYQDLSEALLIRALADPKASALMQEAATDPNMNNQTLLATGFTFGVCAAVSAMYHGEIKVFPSG